MNLQELYFQWPQARLLILVEIVLLGSIWFLYQFRQTQLKGYADPRLLPSLSFSRSNFGFWVKAVALGSVWAMATLSLMQPMGAGEYPKELRLRGSQKAVIGRQRMPQEVVFLLDASASMSVKDMPKGGSRFDYSKQSADQILSRLTGEQATLYAFTSEAIPLSPLTADYLFTRLIVRSLREGEGGTAGTDLYQTLSTIRVEFFTESKRTIPKAIVLLSDGGDTLLETLEGRARQKREEEILHLLDEAELNRVRLLVIGLGSAQGAPVPGVIYQNQPVTSKVEEGFLQKLALAGGGRYFEAERFSVMDLADAVVLEIGKDRRYLEGTTVDENRDMLIHTLYFQIPLGIAILLLLFYLLYPDVPISIGLLFLIVTPQFISGEEAALLHQAQSYYEVQEAPLALQIYKRALETETFPEKRAVLLYNIGTSYLATKEWQKALETLRTIPLSDSPSPLLRYQVKGNLAFAYLKNSMFNQALEELQNAREAKCTLDQAMGIVGCPSDPWLDWLQKAIEQTMKQPQKRQATEEEEQSQKEQTQKVPLKAIPLLLEMAQQDMVPVLMAPSKKDPRPW